MPIKTSSAIKPPFSIGILGGGQLARFLVEKGQNLGVKTWVMSQDKDDPAAQVTSHWIQGDPKVKKDLTEFLKNFSHLTFESEFADIDLIKAVAPKTLQIFPTLEHIKILQDRFYKNHCWKITILKLPPFFKVSDSKDLERCAEFFKFKYVLKKRFGGYDGYGTFIAKSKKDHRKIQQLVTDFSAGYIAEAYVPFAYECACTFFRNQNDQSTETPLVFSKQSQSKCDFIYGPIHHAAFEKNEKENSSSDEENKLCGRFDI